MKDGIIDDFRVRTVRDRKTKNLIGEYWEKADVGPHRVFGPARAEFDADGNPLNEFHYLHGEIHRREDKGPAVTIWSPNTHQITQVEYWDYGARHRSGQKPAVIVYDEYSGEIVRREFWEQGHPRPPPTEDPDISP